MPADSNGIVFRAIAVPGWTEFFSTLGFSIESVAFEEAFQALQTGTVEATDGEPSLIQSENWNEVRHANQPLSERWLSTRRSWGLERPSGDDQDSLQEAFDTGREQSVPEIEAREEQSLEEMTDNGSLTLVDHPDIPAFREAVEPVFESYLGEQSVLSPDEFRNLAP